MPEEKKVLSDQHVQETICRMLKSWDVIRHYCSWCGATDGKEVGQLKMGVFELKCWLGMVEKITVRHHDMPKRVERESVALKDPMKLFLFLATAPAVPICMGVS